MARAHASLGIARQPRLGQGQPLTLMGPREFVRMDQEERLARVGVLCTGPTRLLRPPLLDATETKCGFPRTYQHGVVATLGFSPRGVDSSDASDVPLLVS